ncbi:MAG: ABC transporter permease [Rhodovibrionaceae bacterium]
MSAQPGESALAAAARGVSGEAVSFSRLLARRFLRNRLAVAAGIFLVLLALAALAAPLAAALFGAPSQIDLLAIGQPPSLAHPLGTDELGRDLLVRLLYGGRVSLAVGLMAALCAAVIGTSLGLLAGYFGGRLDSLLMRFADSVIALPLLPLLIVLAAVDLGELGIPASIAQSEDVSLYRIVFLIALVGWTTVARLVRGATLSLKQREYVRAAEALGASHLRLMAVHILPNAVSPIIVATTLSVGNIILLESVLSFLGLGIQPPIPSWGNMLTGAQEVIWSNPMLAVWPGLFIFLTVIGFNLLGDGLQDALDPRSTISRRALRTRAAGKSVTPS